MTPNRRPRRRTTRPPYTPVRLLDAIRRGRPVWTIKRCAVQVAEADYPIPFDAWKRIHAWHKPKHHSFAHAGLPPEVISRIHLRVEPSP